MNVINSSLVKLLKASLFLAFFAPSVAYTDTFKTRSSEYPVALIELYTSQGCSSCPPAEEWLGNLSQIGINKDKAIPLALHVDYWDYIGWKDEFAQKYFTKRQYQYRQTNHSSSVYTPQIMFNGEDVRRVKLQSSFNQLRTKKAPVAFSVLAETKTDSVDVHIDFSRIDHVAKNSRLIVVLAENNLVRDIHAGENSGRKLSHNHVVRVWKNAGSIRNNMSVNLPIKQDLNRDNLEIIVAVETTDMQTQQAVQLALK